MLVSKDPRKGTEKGGKKGLINSIYIQANKSAEKRGRERGDGRGVAWWRCWKGKVKFFAGGGGEGEEKGEKEPAFSVLPTE